LKSIYILILLLIVGCTSKGLERRKLNEYYLNNGVTRYFLPEIPKWVNRSEFSNCFRESSAKFLDFKSVSQSYDLSFEKTLHLQMMMNQEIQQLKSMNHIQSINLKEEEKIFFKSIEKIQAGIKGFQRPTYKRVNIYLIDNLIADKRPIKSILSNSDFLDSGHPVILSFCKNHTELRKLLADNDLIQTNIKVIPFEALTSFDEKFNLTTSDSIHLNMLFKKNQKIYLYGNKKKKVTNQLTGKFINK
tara:strand:+ start:62928 stop:63665 length:738 start_codon:yes stop_codon:yes gene_type:complete